MDSIVSASWLFKKLNQSNLVVLDVSPESNVSNLKVHHPDIQIKGAIPFDFKNKIVDQQSSLPNTLPTPKVFEEEVRKLGINEDSEIVVYDNLGIYASPRVWWMFQVMGHKNIAVLDGGLNAWKEKDFPTEKTHEHILSQGDFTAYFQEKLYKSSEDMLSNISSETQLIVDARSKDRFLGNTPEKRENLKSGHIPKSKNLPFKEVLKNGCLRPTNELVDLFDSINPTGKEMTFTCGSGITACILKLAAFKIGYTESAIYDGSWTEWGQIKDAPIEK